MKLPALHFYVGDWRKSLDVQSLSYHDRGVWLEMLCFMFESEQRGKLIRKGKAISDEDICRLLGLDKQTGTTTITALLESGVASRDEDTGALMSRRMVRDESLRKVRSEVGKLGGNPNLVKQKPTTGDNQNPEDEIEDEDEGESEGKPAAALELVYSEYPLKAAKPRALKAIARALKEKSVAELIAITRAYAQASLGQDRQYIPHPASWFNAKRYEDDPATWFPRAAQKPGQRNGEFELQTVRAPQ